jgi:hypothetical protein
MQIPLKKNITIPCQFSLSDFNNFIDRQKQLICLTMEVNHRIVQIIIEIILIFENCLHETLDELWCFG